MPVGRWGAMPERCITAPVLCCLPTIDTKTLRGILFRRTYTLLFACCRRRSSWTSPGLHPAQHDLGRTMRVPVLRPALQDEATPLETREKHTCLGRAVISKIGSLGPTEPCLTHSIRQPDAGARTSRNELGNASSRKSKWLLEAVEGSGLRNRGRCLSLKRMVSQGTTKT